MLLLPTFRLPTLVHTRSGNAKWLYEISNRNPLWLNPEDARRFGVDTGGLLKVATEIGYFIDKVWVTESIRPGVIACSHHLGRWRLKEESGGERWASGLVELTHKEEGTWMMRQVHGVQPFASADPDSGRIWWQDAGVHQNLIFPVQPDPDKWPALLASEGHHRHGRAGRIAMATFSSTRASRTRYIADGLR